jgi:hypothetical protein
MASRKQQEYAQWIMQEIGQINPYNRQNQNMPKEYYIYTAGYLAAYLGSLLAEDVAMRRQFERHVAGNGPAAKKAKRG